MHGGSSADYLLACKEARIADPVWVNGASGSSLLSTKNGPNPGRLRPPTWAEGAIHGAHLRLEITPQVPDGRRLHRKPDRDVPRVTDDLRSAVCVGLAPVRLAFPKRFQKQHELFGEHRRNPV